MLASEYGQVTIVKYLLKHGNYNVKGWEKDNLHIAMYRVNPLKSLRFLHCVKKLIILTTNTY